MLEASGRTILRKIFAAKKNKPFTECPHRNERHKLMHAMLDPRTAAKIRILECKCGKQIWSVSAN